MPTACGYIRVSTDEQANEGFSLDNQKNAIKEYCRIKNYTLKRLFIEDGKSARTTDRPAFQELIKECEENPPDIITILRVDRFARDVADFANTYKFLKDKEIKLISIQEGDLTGSSSLVANIFASVAQWESEVNSQRTKDALMQKFRDGWYPGPAPHGYMSVGGKGERKTHRPDPKTAPIIKQLFQLYSTGGYSILQLEEWMASKNILSKNGTPLGHSVICNILNNDFYHGLISWHGQSKIGKHKPIISKQLFDICQYILAKHRDFVLRRRKHDFLLRGFVFCAECGQRYTAEWHDLPRSSKKDKIAYYHCPKQNKNGCKAPYAELENLERKVERQFKKIQFNPGFIEEIVRETKQHLANARDNARLDKITLQNQKAGLETKRNRLEDAPIEGFIDRQSFKRKHDELQRKINNLEAEIKEIESESRVDIKLIEDVLNLTRNIHETYQDAPTFLKRQYLRFFFEKIFVRDKKIVKVTYTPIFSALKRHEAVIIRGLRLQGRDSNPQPTGYT